VVGGLLTDKARHRFMRHNFKVQAAPLGARLQRLLADDFVVLTVGSDPNPQNSVIDFRTEGSVMPANAHRPQLTETFEMKGRMLWIALEKKVVLVRE